jgi:hypothetical protein
LNYEWPGVVGIAAIAALLIGMTAMYRSHKRRGMGWTAVAAVAIVLFAGVAIIGCGGGGGSSSGGTNPSGGTTFGTPAGTYTLTVTATTGSGANAVSHAMNLTLVVQ